MSLPTGTRNIKAHFGLSSAAAFLTLTVLVNGTWPTNAQDGAYTPEFTGEKMLMRPKDHLWREWIYVGSLVTPNALNNGNAPFPEQHMVYIDPVSWAHYKKTGEFREGTVIAKELTRVRAPDGANENGSTDEVSGTGYFMGEYSGLEITIKSKKLYPDEPGHWAYYTFGHKPEPYDLSAKRQPADACNACHESAAAEDFVFTQFYPVLRGAKPK